MEIMKHKMPRRPMGGPEKLFIVLDHFASKSFAIAAELEGIIPGGRLNEAIQAVQKRHPHLTARIQVDQNLTYWFDFSNETAIEVEERHDYLPSEWGRFLEDVLSIPLDVSLNPLFRVFILGSGERTTLILVAHHSIGDGQSLLIIYQDILAYLSGDTLPTLAPSKSIDELLGLENRLLLEDTPLAIGHLSSRESQGVANHAIRIDSLQLDHLDTSKIILASRQNGVTVNGLLNAALCLAITEINQKKSFEPLSLRSPASVRNTLDVKNNFGLYIVTKLTTVVPSHSKNIWNLAKWVNSDLQGINSFSSIVENIKRYRQILLRPFVFNKFLDMFRSSPKIDLMLTNLGNIELNTRHSGIKVKALWGPMVLSGDGSEQTVGAITINGNLHLTNTSIMVCDRLLHRACDIIFDAI